MKEKISQFTSPLEKHEIEWKINSYTKDKSKTIVVPYIDNRAVMERLDKCFGAENWSSKFEDIGNGILCTLSIRFGDEWISKQDGADKTTIEETKGGISNAMKRASTQWGLGRELYNYPKIMFNEKLDYLKPEHINRLNSLSKDELAKQFLLL